MNERDFREKIMKYRISNGKEPYWIYMNRADLDELINDSMFTYTHYMEFYELNTSDTLKPGEIVMKPLPYLQVSIDGKITSNGKVIGNIEFESEWTSYRARDKIVLHWR